MNTTLPTGTPARPSMSAVAGYVAMLAVAVGLVMLIRVAGESLTTPATGDTAGLPVPAESGKLNLVAHVLGCLAAVIALGFVLGRLLRFVGQPPVIGEVLAGIVLGPSLLGAVWPDAMHLLIPDTRTDPNGQVPSALKAIAELGIVLYMFLVGLELDAARLRRNAPVAVAVSHASIVTPFVLGVALALWLYPGLSRDGVSFTSFSLFMGAAMAVTAFPVLARILTDRGLASTDLGVTALGCAAADDVTAWCLLALVIGVTQAQVGGALAAGVGVVGFTVAMLTLGRPLAAAASAWIDRQPGPLPAVAMPGVLAAILLSALATEAVGIHMVFGAFLLGVILPHDGRLAREFTARVRDLVAVLLLPAFFAFTGMRTRIDLLIGWEAWLTCGLIILVATAGKFGGSFVAARLAGMGWRDAAALGTLMNTRGLMELIVLNIGLDLGIISPTVFAMMVVMALVTTAATGPILDRLVMPARAPSADEHPTQYAEVR